MSFAPPTIKSPWTKRIDRARDLAARMPSSKQLLDCYLHILEFQHEVHKGIAQQPVGPVVLDATALRHRINLDDAVRHFPARAALVQRGGPPKLAERAQRLHSMTREQLRDLLSKVASGSELDNENAFFARVLLQPYAEQLARTSDAKGPTVIGNKCPRCGGEPQLAVIRPEGDGGKRSLLCSLCQWEWEFRRIWCPACGEETHEKLPRYSAEGIPAVRVEACETCRRYLKSIDLTVDGHAIPIVDEVATVPLDLWAVDRGYQKLKLNVLGF